MLSREHLIKLVRRSQTYISIFIFLAVFFVCWKFANLDIREIELSKWGKSGWIGRIWNSAVCLFAISIFVNSFLYLKNNTRAKYKKKFYFLFGFLSACLFVVGFFTFHVMKIITQTFHHLFSHFNSGKYILKNHIFIW